NVIVEYPFRLTNQPDCCGHPDFNLSVSCRSRYHLPDQTIISHLPLAEISVPLRSPGWPTNYIDDILLTWEQPYCVFPPCNHCESNCQSENGDGECSRKKRGMYVSNKTMFILLLNFMLKHLLFFQGLSSSTKYAVIFIVGTPISLIAVCIIYYNIRVHCYDHRHQPNAEISSLTEEQQLADITVNGLDGSRIEAYPITLLGENFELPRPNDNTCSICLSEYQAKETIRTIPDCNHYFHANCIDEWFKLNAACPVCRNTPDHDSARLITRSTSAFSSRPPL
ncbi:hypothetical protein E1A91_D03G094500v1, partial [Gossypium mustelinum]